MPKQKVLKRPDLMIEDREIEAISLECARCACRVEVAYGGSLLESATCPGCGRDMTHQREVLRLFAALLDESSMETAVRLRVRLQKRPKGRRQNRDREVAVPAATA